MFKIKHERTPTGRRGIARLEAEQGDVPDHAVSPGDVLGLRGELQDE